MGTCHADIQEITSTLDSFEKNGTLSNDIVAHSALTSLAWSKSIKQGNYLLRVYGQAFDNTGQGINTR